MDKITISKIGLRKAIEQNKAKHDMLLGQACEGYRRRLKEHFEKQLGLFESKWEKLKTFAATIVDTDATTLGSRTSKFLREFDVQFELAAHHPNFKPPDDHSEDYKTALLILEYQEGETIELSADQFRKLVQNKWDWRTDFLQTCHGYSGYSGATGTIGTTPESTDEF